MKFYRLLLIIPLMILMGCDDYSLQDPFKGPNGLYGYKDGDGKIRVKAKYQKANSFRGDFARVWLNDQDGKNNRVLVAGKMSPQQIERTQLLARNWKPKKK